ncbi:hypothetical protein Leryth_002315 [Lithospermum erythrorhizon]|nr:hypothetical protein Leryth_002315 [Lithospermum erythrorhizon]
MDGLICVQGNANVHFFGVFDGHGLFGTQCAKSYNAAFLVVNEELRNSEIDDSMSGTTAITVLVVGDKLYVANVGDSRAVMAVKEGNGVLAGDLSSDQTPFRNDECERVKLCGARVLSVDQVEGLKDPGIQSWGDEETEGNDPPRLWVQNGMYPGTAFTRSVGDSTAEKIGVIAVPEVLTIQLTPENPFFVIASDGAAAANGVIGNMSSESKKGKESSKMYSTPARSDVFLSVRSSPDLHSFEKALGTDKSSSTTLSAIAT